VSLPPLRSKYSLLKHPESVLFPQHETPSYTPVTGVCCIGYTIILEIFWMWNVSCDASFCYFDLGQATSNVTQNIRDMGDAGRGLGQSTILVSARTKERGSRAADWNLVAFASQTVYRGESPDSGRVVPESSNLVPSDDCCRYSEHVKYLDSTTRIW